MHIVIDIRGLTHKHQSGVGMYTDHLLRALFSLETKNSYTLFSSGTSLAQQHLPLFDFPQVTHTHKFLPNKLLNASLLGTGRPLFNTFFKKTPEPISLFFFPNMNIIRLQKRTPYVLTIHDLSFEIFPQFYSKKSQLWHKLAQPKKLAQNAKAIIVPSQNTKEDVINFYHIPEEHLFVIPHGLSDIFSPQKDETDEKLKKRFPLPKHFVLFVGDQDRRKNLSILPEAIDLYRKQTGKDLHLVCAGKKGTATLTKKSFVHFLDYICEKEKPALYRAALATVFPSFYEGFGLPILESMACGTPVIASHTSSIPETGADTALFIDPYNVMDITIALQQLLSSQPLQERLKQNGLERTKLFSWKKSAQKHLEVFEHILKNDFS